MMNFIQKIFGTKNERELKRIAPLVDEINRFEPAVKKLSDEELRAKTAYFKEKLSNGASLDDILTEAFAVVREASWRTVGMRPFDVQLIGGIVLHEGKIAEMKTGEGKTLAATMPLYLNALTGKGAQLVTVNDYLARRDASWMGPIYNFLGLSVGIIVHGLTDEERRKAYHCDITYGTNNEFGFDYLRDNMKFTLEDYVQRDFHYAIVDEVDSILVDEARTPLIISGPSEESTDKYYRINQIIPGLRKEKDYTIDEKARTVVLTEEGVARVEKALKVENLFDPRNIELLHHVNQALKAHTLFKRDVDYVVKDGEVLIVDEFTGRLMPGRRYSEGLHQALEAKENVKIERENQTLASVTFQNYFRMYEKLAGMTGTADTEAAEFKEIYDLEVMVIPTNMPMIRTDHSDVIYRTEKEKYDAAIEEIKELHKQGRPVLVGTISIEHSEKLSTMLSRTGVKHHVLNAKHHEREAEIISQAGQRGGVTISTNMAGRGTDIKLGEGVAQLGGLHILGTETAREPPDRQPAQGAIGAPGRCGLFAVLPFPGRRSAADLRRRAHPVHHGAHRDRGRTADRGQPAEQGDRERAEAGRGAQLRYPQTPPGIRQRDERPARGHIRAAQGRSQGRGPLGDARGDARRGRRNHSSGNTWTRSSTPRSGTSRASMTSCISSSPSSFATVRRAGNGRAGNGWSRRSAPPSWRICAGRKKRSASRCGTT